MTDAHAKSLFDPEPTSVADAEATRGDAVAQDAVAGASSVAGSEPTSSADGVAAVERASAERRAAAGVLPVADGLAADDRRAADAERDEAARRRARARSAERPRRWAAGVVMGGVCCVVALFPAHADLYSESPGASPYRFLLDALSAVLLANVAVVVVAALIALIASRGGKRVLGFDWFASMGWALLTSVLVGVLASVAMGGFSGYAILAFMVLGGPAVMMSLPGIPILAIVGMIVTGLTTRWTEGRRPA